MTKYRITAPEPRFNGEFAGLVFRAGEAAAETPADQAAVTYCQRRGYIVTVDAGEQDADETLEDNGGVVPRPNVAATKADWVAYAVSRGASEEDASNATKNELIELYG
jgi:hypothetical protein